MEYKELLKSENFISTVADLLLEEMKGGEGSGSWDGPGQPRFAHEGGEDKKGSGFSDKVKVRESEYSGHLTSEFNRLSTDYPNAIFHSMIDENPLVVSVTDKLPVGRFGENGYMPSGSGGQFIKISTACFIEGGSKELGQATLRHEFGHYILRNLDDADENKVKQLYEKNRDTIRFPSDMKANWKEVFAESFSRVTDTKKPGDRVPPDIQSFIKSRILKDGKAATVITKSLTTKQKVNWEQRWKRIIVQGEKRYAPRVRAIFESMRNDVMGGIKKGLVKGGAGSGSWNGPGDPRFAREEGESTSTNSIGKDFSKWVNGDLLHQDLPKFYSSVEEAVKTGSLDKGVFYSGEVYRAQKILDDDELKQTLSGKNGLIGKGSIVSFSKDIGSIENFAEKYNLNGIVFKVKGTGIDSVKLYSSLLKAGGITKGQINPDHLESENEVVVKLTAPLSARHVVADISNGYVEMRRGKKQFGIQTILKANFNYRGYKFDKPKWQEKFAEEQGAFVKEMYDQVGNEVFDYLKYVSKNQDLEGAFDVENPNVQEFIDDYSYKFAEDAVDVTVEDLQDAMSRGMEEGEDIGQIADRLQAKFDNMSDYRAELIARTETIRASNYAAIESYKQSGVVRAKEWLVTEDDRTCPLCQEMQGVVIELDQNFLSMDDELSAGGTTMTVDYEDVGGPPLHPACRCTLIPVVDEQYLPGYQEEEEKQVGILSTLKGGAGSGNYDGPGQPRFPRGETGSVFHGTTADIGKLIAKEGLKGNGGLSGYGVYAARTFVEALSFGYDKAKMKYQCDVALAVCDPKAFTSQSSGEIHLSKTDNVPPDKIKRVEFYKYKDADAYFKKVQKVGWDRAAEEVKRPVPYKTIGIKEKQIDGEVYVCFVFVNEEEEQKQVGILSVLKGGPGSGNYDGPGQPRFDKEDDDEFGDHFRQTPADPNAPSTLYHGTSALFVDSILKEGLRSDKQHAWSEFSMSGERRSSVFMARDEGIAAGWGLAAFEKFKAQAGFTELVKMGEARCAVFKVEIPRGEKIKPDELLTNGYRKVGNIPPEWIKGVSIYKSKGAARTPDADTIIGRNYELVESRTFKAGGQFMYVPMIYIEKKKTTKGGEGSGNFGHSGRPGEVGGSGEGGGAGVEFTSTRDNHGAWMEARGITERDVTSVFKGLDKSITVKIDILAPTTKNGAAYIEATFKEGRKEVGSLVFGVENKNMKIGLYNLNKEQQGTGQAHAVMAKLEQLAKKMGCETISLEANISIGTYAWARLGFDYKYKGDLIEAKDTLRRWVADIAEYKPKLKVDFDLLNERISKIKTAKDMSEFTMPGFNFTKKGYEINNNDIPRDMRMNAGKAFMLGTHQGWVGVRRLK